MTGRRGVCPPKAWRTLRGRTGGATALHCSAVPTVADAGPELREGAGVTGLHRPPPRGCSSEPAGALRGHGPRPPSSPPHPPPQRVCLQDTTPRTSPSRVQGDPGQRGGSTDKRRGGPSPQAGLPGAPAPAWAGPPASTPSPPCRIKGPWGLAGINTPSPASRAPPPRLRPGWGCGGGVWGDSRGHSGNRQALTPAREGSEEEPRRASGSEPSRYLGTEAPQVGARTAHGGGATQTRQRETPLPPKTAQAARNWPQKHLERKRNARGEFVCGAPTSVN